MKKVNTTTIYENDVEKWKTENIYYIFYKWMRLPSDLNKVDIYILYL